MRVGASYFAVFEDGRIARELPFAGESAWMGIATVNANDVILVARGNQLLAADASGNAKPRHLAGAPLPAIRHWDAAGAFVVAASSDRVALSRDAGRTFAVLAQPGTGEIERALVRHDGLVAVHLRAAESRRTLLQSRSERGWRIAAFRGRQLVRDGAFIWNGHRSCPVVLRVISDLRCSGLECLNWTPSEPSGNGLHRLVLATNAECVPHLGPALCASAGGPLRGDSDLLIVTPAGAPRLMPRLAGCRVRRVWSFEGIGIAVCDDGKIAAVELAASTPVWEVHEPTLALKEVLAWSSELRASRAPDGTVLVQFGRYSTVQLAVRAPLAVGAQGAWRSIAYRLTARSDGIFQAARVLPGGRALVALRRFDDRHDLILHRPDGGQDRLGSVQVRDNAIDLRIDRCVELELGRELRPWTRAERDAAARRGGVRKCVTVDGGLVDPPP